MKLEQTLRALYDEAVEFVIIGGAAMLLQGSASLTEDLDFCYARSRKNIQRLARAMGPYKPALRNAPEELPFQFDANTIERGLNFTLSTELGPIDLLGEVAGLGNYEAVKASSENIVLFGMHHRILSLEGLLRSKRAAGRKKDLQDIEELRALLDLKKRSDPKA